MMPNGWIEVEFGELLDYVQPTKYIVKSTDYNDNFKTPVLTPGKSFIKGYTDEKEGIFDDLPAIIFDDFTTASRFVNFPFKVKSSAMKILVPFCDLVNLKYLFLGMSITKIRNDTHKRYWISDFSKKTIPLPPLVEQHRIVAKIEELFSELDNGVENLKLAQNQLKVYRQALLKHAFEGRLTEKWRKENNPEPAEKLLERIKKERQARYDQELKDWKADVKKWEKEGKKGKKPGKPRKIKDLGEFSSSDIKEFPSLPKQWGWTKVDLLSEYGQYSIKAGPFGSSLKKEFYTESGYKIYGQEQVISGEASYGDYYVGQEKYDELISCSIKPKDVLISLVGTVGKVLVLPEDCEKGIINPRLIKLSLDHRHYLAFMFKYYFESYFLKSLYSTHTHGATMDVLNLGIIQGLPFPFMALEEQEEIVSEIESQFSIIDNLEREIESNFKKSEALRQSILKEAFEGQLVDQNTNDEPASELLKRIQIEKQKYLEEQKQQKKKAPKKTKKMSKELSIEDVLIAAKKPMLAKDVWQQSKHKENIEEFYAELKKIQNQVKEVKKGTESLLSLSK